MLGTCTVWCLNMAMAASARQIPNAVPALVGVAGVAMFTVRLTDAKLAMYLATACGAAREQS